MSGVSPGRRLSAPRYVDVLSHGSCWRLGLVARRRRIQLYTGSRVVVRARRQRACAGPRRASEMRHFVRAGGVRLHFSVWSRYTVLYGCKS